VEKPGPEPEGVRKVELVDRAGWAEKWVRPILVASIPAFIAAWAVVRTDRNETRLHDAAERREAVEVELQDTRDELERTRRELQEGAKEAARDEVERAGEERRVASRIAREVVSKPHVGPLNPERDPATPVDVVAEVMRRWPAGKAPPRRVYVEQAVAEVAEQ